MAECEDRDARRTVRRTKEAGFPRSKSLAEFDYEANPQPDAAPQPCPAASSRLFVTLDSRRES
ncbi:MAG: hypothetical protein ACRDQ7_08690 [Haloechinothrix sp.]